MKEVQGHSSTARNTPVPAASYGYAKINDRSAKVGKQLRLLDEVKAKEIPEVVEGMARAKDS